MLNIDIFTTGIAGLFFGILLVLAGGGSFASSCGVIVFCYGLGAILYSGWNKLNGVDKI